MRKTLPTELKSLVRQTLACLGDEIRESFGVEAFKNIEEIRKEMAKLRNSNLEKTMAVLKKRGAKLLQTTTPEKFQIAQAFTLMMELMNSCENAYRSFRLREGDLKVVKSGAYEIIFVVTAHPTEARATTTIPVLKDVQKLLVRALEESFAQVEVELRTYIRLLLHLPMAPVEAPTPQDEAENLYRWILDPDLLNTVLDREDLRRRVRFRSWAGGDKDGHPGINADVMLASLGLSRKRILLYLKGCLREADLLLRGATFYDQALWATISQIVGELEKVSAGDAERCISVQSVLNAEILRIEKILGVNIVPLKRAYALTQIFPKWVVPLELREGADIIEGIVKAPDPAQSEEAIAGMLRALSELAPQQGITHYAQALILSMVRDEYDLEYAAQLQNALWGKLRLPIIPLFETRSALEDSRGIVDRFLKTNPGYAQRVRELWSSRFEVMLGYSDSAKESGVLASRVMIAQAMRGIEADLKSHEITPVFFHGTGGSTSRGGGPIEEQMAWWTPGALKLHKVTIQGEMVARTFASPEHFLRQIQGIDLSSSSLAKMRKLAPLPKSLLHLARENAEVYAQTVGDPLFLQRVQKTTIYPFLHTLRIGSRPSKRKGLSQVSDLRAIPWVLCWTQNRVHFPAWWGLVQAWQKLSKPEMMELQKAATINPLWATYLKQLGFTLARVDMAPWFEKLERMAKEDTTLLTWEKEFNDNFNSSVKLLAKIVHQRNLLWFRPWLNESIHLRRTMIYPLNLLQDIAEDQDDEKLLRLTVTGIASGMLTAG